MENDGAIGESMGGLGGSLDPSKPKDRVLIRRAIKRWPVPDKLKAAMIEKVGMCLLHENTVDPRDIAGLSRVIVMAEAQNQADDHLEEKNSRIDEGKGTELQLVKTYRNVDMDQV